jgi:hypothetical protein
MSATHRAPANCRSRREQKRRKGSSTTGKSKGLVPDKGDRAMARQSRSYKRPDYTSWCARMYAKNHNAPKT